MISSFVTSGWLLNQNLRLAGRNVVFVETNYQAEDEKNSTANHEPHPLLILQVGDESGQDHDDKDDHDYPFGVADSEKKHDDVVLVC